MEIRNNTLEIVHLFKICQHVGLKVYERPTFVLCFKGKYVLDIVTGA